MKLNWSQNKSTEIQYILFKSPTLFSESGLFNASISFHLAASKYQIPSPYQTQAVADSMSKPLICSSDK